MERNGSPDFYKLLEKMAETHDKKNHDYANNDNPFQNFERAAVIVSWFTNPVDQTFAAIIGIKLSRLAELRSAGKEPNNESVEDSFLDNANYNAIWAAWDIWNNKKGFNAIKQKMENVINTTLPHEMAGHQFLICGVHFTEICTRCNEGEDRHRLQHAIAVHSAAYDPKNHTLKYPNKPKLCLVGPKINLVD